MCVLAMCSGFAVTFFFCRFSTTLSVRLTERNRVEERSLGEERSPLVFCFEGDRRFGPAAVQCWLEGHFFIRKVVVI
jgi:hypothetical protein